MWFKRKEKKVGSVKMESDEILETVFPFLEGVDLASCKAVCKKWRDFVRDDYTWKCVCVKRWPSINKRPYPPTLSYYNLCRIFNKVKYKVTLRPNICFENFDDLEFFVDIWDGDKLLFSQVVPGYRVLKPGIKCSSSSDMLKLTSNLEDSEPKMIVPIEPRFTISSSRIQNLRFSVLIGWKDSNKFPGLTNKWMYDYISRTRDIKISKFDTHYCEHPSLWGIRTWISPLFTEEGEDEGAVVDVYGLQMALGEVANSKEELMWMLEMLDSELLDKDLKPQLLQSRYCIFDRLRNHITTIIKAGASITCSRNFFQLG